MSLADDILVAAKLAARDAASVASVTDWGVVDTVGPPTLVLAAGDATAQAFGVVDGLSLSVGDTVGLVRFGRRWFVTTILVGV
jgi:hypothetical protein